MFSTRSVDMTLARRFNAGRKEAGMMGSRFSDVCELRNPIIDLLFAEEVFPGVLGDESQLLQLEIRALDLASIDGKFLSEGGRRGK